MSGDARPNVVLLGVVHSVEEARLHDVGQALADAQNGDAIQFDPALNGHTISLSSGELVINKNVSINGPGPELLGITRSQNAPPFGIIHIMPSHTVAIQGLTISGGLGPKGGPSGWGGIYNEQGTLTLDSCTVEGNLCFCSGAGIINTGTLTVSHTTIRNNFGDFGGGGISNGGTLTITNSVVRYNSCGNPGALIAGHGGGIFNGGTAAIVSSTIDDNMAGGGSVGGGIYSAEAGHLTISNSTISGNFAGQDGGGVYNVSPLIITNSTLSGNGATRQGGGIINFATLEIGNTILKTGSSGANIVSNPGTVTSHGYNLSSDNGSGFLTAPGDQINTNPMLGPLQDNGGPTFTHALLPGSPAINAGDPNFTPPPFTDQRGPGYARVFNGRIDIGSFEAQPTPPPITISGTISYCSNPVPGPVPNVVLTLTGSASGTMLSDGAGNYIFSSLASGGTYTVTPSKAALAPASPGINTVDVVAVQRYFLSIGTPLSGCRLAAADVNGDNVVNTVDIVAIQRFYLGAAAGTANVGQYKFTPVSRTYPGLISNETGQNYDALVLGDVVAPFVE